MLDIIIPLAGSSALFINAGFFYPKPLIDVDGVIMIERVMEQFSHIEGAYRFIFIIKEEDAISFHLDNTLKLLAQNCEIIKLKRSTKGGLCSVLMGADIINDDDSILIVNGDQILDVDFNELNNNWKANNADAGLLTFKSIHPRWSYARIEGERVVQTAEKNPISNHAIAGYYYFSKAKDFFDAAYQTIFNDVHIDGDFFISPVINQYVLKNKEVHYLSIQLDQYHSFYSPQMIVEFERKNRK